MKTLIITIFFTSSLAFANKNIEIDEGIHILAGAGINFSAFRQSGDDPIYVAGSAFHADVGWYYSNNWSIESSAQVKFSDLNDILIWDSLFTLGARYRFKDFHNLYTKIYLGHSITVAYTNDARSPGSGEFNRNHYEGQLIGFGIGKMFQTDSGLKWFIEANTTLQEMKFIEFVSMDGERAEVVDKQYIEEKTTIRSFMLTVGALVF